MPWYIYLLTFIAGAFAANAVPHLVQGMSGNRFQTPFASPPGVGESALVNVIWGTANVAIAGALLHYILPPEFPPPPSLCIAGGVGALISAIFMALHFGKVRNAGPHP